jgi:hypothetical protein
VGVAGDAVGGVGDRSKQKKKKKKKQAEMTLGQSIGSKKSSRVQVQGAAGSNLLRAGHC